MEYQATVNNQKSERKKYLFQLYVALGSSIAACVSYFFYKELTLIFIISNILSMLPILRDKIFE